MYHFQFRKMTEPLQDNIFLDFVRAIYTAEYQNAQWEKRRRKISHCVSKWRRFQKRKCLA